MRNSPRPRHRRGFTLVELIVVLVILGLLAAIAIPTYRAVTQRAAETAEKSSIEVVGRAAAAIAANHRKNPPGREHFEAAFNETPNFGAAAAGVSAQEAGRVAVIVPGVNPEGAEIVFLWGEEPDERTSVIISPSTSNTSRCVALAVTGSTVRSGIIDPSYHLPAGHTLGGTLAEQCHPTVALNWALDVEEAPPATTTTVAPPATTTTTVPDPIVPAVPTGLAASPHSTGVDLTWDPVDSEDATYDVARDGTDATATGITDTVYGDIGLNSSTTYTYRVRACVEGCSEWSAPVSATTTASAPAAPTGFRFTDSTSNAITFAWDNDPIADRYEVQRQGVAQPVNTTNTSYTWSGLAASGGSGAAAASQMHTYDFRVRSCNATGCSAWTDYASMTTAGYLLVNAVSSNSAANSTGTEVPLTVPAGVKRVYLQAAGAKGANGGRCSTAKEPAGTGARGTNVTGVLNVTPGALLSASAGKQGNGRFGGWPGGGNGTAEAMSSYCATLANSGAGGGYSRWTLAGTDVMVGGGGGGGGSTTRDAGTSGSGGDGGAGGLLGVNGTDGSIGTAMLMVHGFAGAGGRANRTTAPGGNYHIVAGWNGHKGGDGTAGTGGHSGNYGGGGGGGYGGGGAGGAVAQSPYGIGAGAGAGGGASYTAGSVTGATSATSLANDGRVCVSWHGHTGCGPSTPFLP